MRQSIKPTPKQMKPCQCTVLFNAAVTARTRFGDRSNGLSTQLVGLVLLSFVFGTRLGLIVCIAMRVAEASMALFTQADGILWTRADLGVITVGALTSQLVFPIESKREELLEHALVHESLNISNRNWSIADIDAGLTGVETRGFMKAGRIHLAVLNLGIYVGAKASRTELVAASTQLKGIRQWLMLKADFAIERILGSTQE